jgi:hypothetical protein
MPASAFPVFLLFASVQTFFCWTAAGLQHFQQLFNDPPVANRNGGTRSPPRLFIISGWLSRRRRAERALAGFCAPAVPETFRGTDAGRRK